MSSTSSFVVISPSERRPLIVSGRKDKALLELEQRRQRGVGIITTKITRLLILTNIYTTALCVILYHVLANSEILLRLSMELESAMPDPAKLPACVVLENLPYLIGLSNHLNRSILIRVYSATVSEGLRLSHGVCKRLPELAYTPIHFKPVVDGTEREIPPRTPVSMTTTLVHHNPNIFPDPKSFIPERWISNPSLSRYLMSFGIGSRGCLGMK